MTPKGELQEYVQALERENQAKNAETDSLSKKIHQLKAQLASSYDRSHEDKLRKQIESYKQQLRDLNQALKDVVLENVRLRQSQKYQELEEWKVMRQAISQLKLNNETQTATIQKLSEELQSSCVAAEECRRQLQKRQNEMAELEEQSRRNSAQVEQQIEELNGNYENIYSIVVEKDSQLDKFSALLVEVQQENQSLQKQMNQMRKDLEQDGLNFLSKKELIRQNNQLIESVNRLRKQSKGKTQEHEFKSSRSRIRILKEETQNLINHLKY